MRFALPNARIMVHQPSGGYQGQVTDILIHAREVESLKRRLNEIYEKHTGKDYKTIEEALERDNFMTAEVREGVRHRRPGHGEAPGRCCPEVVRADAAGGRVRRGLCAGSVPVLSTPNGGGAY